MVLFDHHRGPNQYSIFIQSGLIKYLKFNGISLPFRMEKHRSLKMIFYTFGSLVITEGASNN